MFKNLLLFIITCIALHTSSVKAQEYMVWHEDSKLTWSDFKGKKPFFSSAAATTVSGIQYDFYTYRENKEELKMEYKVTTFFNPNKSWCKHNDVDDVILGHEQLHFDITELYARKLREELSELNVTNKVKSDVRKIYSKIILELNQFQAQYDIETDYSRKLFAQKRWATKVNGLISESSSQ